MGARQRLQLSDYCLVKDVDVSQPSPWAEKKHHKKRNDKDDRVAKRYRRRASCFVFNLWIGGEGRNDIASQHCLKNV